MNSSSPVSFDPNSFSLTDSAVDHFSNSLSNKDFLGVRFSVLEASGCSGYTYELDYVNEEGPEDMVFTFEAVSYTHLSCRLKLRCRSPRSPNH